MLQALQVESDAMSEQITPSLWHMVELLDTHVCVAPSCSPQIASLVKYAGTVAVNNMWERKSRRVYVRAAGCIPTLAGDRFCQVLPQSMPILAE